MLANSLTDNNESKSTIGLTGNNNSKENLAQISSQNKLSFLEDYQPLSSVSTVDEKAKDIKLRSALTLETEEDSKSLKANKIRQHNRECTRQNFANKKNEFSDARFKLFRKKMTAGLTPG